MNKVFPSSLKVSDVQAHEEILRTNDTMHKNATVLVLVTGDRAQHVTYRSFKDHSTKTVEYDHLERLSISDDERHRPTFSDLNRGYMALTYYSTLAYYNRGADHSWNLASVVPMLSDIIVLPRVLSIKAIKPIMYFYCKAVKKNYRDGLFMAESASFREINMTQVVKPVLPQEEPTQEGPHTPEFGPS